MSDRDELADIIRDQYREPYDEGDDIAMADAVLAAGYRKPVRGGLRDYAALSREGVIIRSDSGGIHQYTRNRWRQIHGVSKRSGYIDVPFTVLHDPDEVA